MMIASDIMPTARTMKQIEQALLPIALIASLTASHP